MKGCVAVGRAAERGSECPVSEEENLPFVGVVTLSSVVLPPTWLAVSESLLRASIQSDFVHVI